MQSKEARAEQVAKAIREIYDQAHRKHVALVAERDALIRRRDAMKAELSALSATTNDTLKINDMLRTLEDLDDQIVSLAETVEDHYVLLEDLLQELNRTIKKLIDRNWHKYVLRFVSVRKAQKLRYATDSDDYNAVRALILKVSEKLFAFMSKNMQDASEAAAAREHLQEIHDEMNRNVREERAKHLADLRARYGAGAADTASAPAATAIPTILTPADVSAEAPADAKTVKKS